MELPDMVVMQVFSQESVFSEFDLTAFGVPGAFCSPRVSVLLLVEARRDTSLVAVRTSNTLHSLSRSLFSSCNTFSCNNKVECDSESYRLVNGSKLEVFVVGDWK